MTELAERLISKYINEGGDTHQQLFKTAKKKGATGSTISSKGLLIKFETPAQADKFIEYLDDYAVDGPEDFDYRSKGKRDVMLTHVKSKK